MNARDTRIQEIVHDPDGWWLYYKPGWIDAGTECHFVHESTKRDVLQTADPIPCDCQECIESHT